MNIKFHYVLLLLTLISSIFSGKIEIQFTVDNFASEITYNNVPLNIKSLNRDRLVLKTLVIQQDVKKGDILKFKLSNLAPYSIGNPGVFIAKIEYVDQRGRRRFIYSGQDSFVCDGKVPADFTSQFSNNPIIPNAKFIWSSDIEKLDIECYTVFPDDDDVEIDTEDSICVPFDYDFDEMNSLRTEFSYKCRINDKFGKPLIKQNFSLYLLLDRIAVEFYNSNKSLMQIPYDIVNKVASDYSIVTIKIDGEPIKARQSFKKVFVKDSKLVFQIHSHNKFEPVYTWFRTGFANGKNAEEYNAKSTPQLINDILQSPQPEGYCTRTNISLDRFSSQITCNGPNRDIYFVYMVKLCVNENDSIVVNSYNDFTTGAVMTMNGEVLTRSTADMWWGGFDLNNVSMKFEKKFTQKGAVLLEVYGAEICCDGNQKMRISYNKQPFQDLTIQNIESYCRSIGVDIDDKIPKPVLVK